VISLLFASFTSSPKLLQTTLSLSDFHMRQLWFPDVEKRQWVGYVDSNCKEILRWKYAYIYSIFAGSKSTRTELKLKITTVTAISIKKVLRE